MSRGWSHLPVTLPSGQMLVHVSARRRSEIVDTVFEMVGGTERLADWADKNYGEFVTKLWAKGMAKPMSIEVNAGEGLEGMLAKLDAGDHAKVISPDGLADEREPDLVDE